MIVFPARIRSEMRSSSVRTGAMIVCLLCAAHAGAVALDPPSLRCASVNLAGDVTLNWVAPPDPGGEFAEYLIWTSSTASGPYSLVTSLLTYGSITYMDLGAGANSGPQYYYLQTVNNALPPDTSIASDTLSTIYLTVGQSTPLGSAVLDWNALHVPPTATAGPQFIVQMEYPIGTWTTVDLVGLDTTYLLHEISICDDTLTFRIAATDALGCVSYSNRIGDWFADVTPPCQPMITTVSVDTASGQAVITWGPCPQADTDGYIILENTGTGNFILDTVWGQFTTTYQWLASNADFGPESFTVAAFDTCWSGTPPSPNTSATLPPHTTIHCTTIHHKCDGEITIDWTPYGGWAVQSYQVYARLNGGSVFLLATEPAGSTSHLLTTVVPFATYAFTVKAIGATPAQTSLSNTAVRFTDYPPVPLYNYLRTATVVGDNEILVIDSVDMSAEVSRYRLQRSANGAPFADVAVIAGGGGPVISWTDTDVEADLRSYRYQVVVDDSCGNEVVTSNEGGTIFLRTEADLSGFNTLVWNGYEDWAGTVSGYAIHRAIGTDPEMLIGVNPPDQWSYVDDVNNYASSTGLFCYRVEALEAGNPVLDATSWSNVACAVQEEQVWIPNAFIAGSAYNPDFKPVFAFLGATNYEFTIINRWGQEIWTTHDPEEAWKGMINGNYVPQGVYAYYCAFTNGEGRQFAKRGTVTFLYAVEN